MHATRFDCLVQSWASSGSRRSLIRLLAAVPLVSPLASLLDDERAGAKRTRQTRRRGSDRLREERKKKKKKPCAKAGQAPSKKRKRCCQGLAKDAARRCAPPSGCTPATCPASACGSVPDGCGGRLSCGGCAANQVCVAGTCQPCIVVAGACQTCTVTCTGTPEACGAALQAALNGGGTIYVCPGRYRGGFTLNTAVTVIGAGEGDSPASNTILDAQGTGRVLQINPGVGLVALERLRLTGGNTSENGSIVNAFRTTLRMTECTVSGNSASGFGGGIFSEGTLEMTRCTVRDNRTTSASGGGISTEGTTTLTDCLVEANSARFTGGGLYCGGSTTLAGRTRVLGNAASFGGGIYVLAPLAIAETCRVMENTAAAAGNGGGIYNRSTVTLQGSAPSPIVVNNCHENCGGTATVPGCAATPVFCPP